MNVLSADCADWVKLGIPTYPKIIKKPMDLATMRKKLEGGEYPNAEAFHDDFKLMINNCMKFNPEGTPVNVCGQQLNALFYEKWKNMPQPRSEAASDDDEDEEDDFEPEDERDRTFFTRAPVRQFSRYSSGMIRDMEAQMEAMNRTLAGLKQQKKALVPHVKHEKKREKPAPVASTSKATPKTSAKKAPTGHKKAPKRPITDDDVLSFEQKKELSDTIGKLDGSKLERVIQIIHEGVPEIRDVSVIAPASVYAPLTTVNTEHGGDRARDRYSASVGSYEAVQLRHPSHAPASCEAGPDGQGHGYWWPQAEEHGRGRRGGEDPRA